MSLKGLKRLANLVELKQHGTQSVMNKFKTPLKYDKTTSVVGVQPKKNWWRTKNFCKLSSKKICKLKK